MCLCVCVWALPLSWIDFESIFKSLFYTLGVDDEKWIGDMQKISIHTYRYSVKYTMDGMVCDDVKMIQKK